MFAIMANSTTFQAERFVNAAFIIKLLFPCSKYTLKYTKLAGQTSYNLTLFAPEIAEYNV